MHTNMTPRFIRLHLLLFALAMLILLGACDPAPQAPQAPQPAPKPVASAPDEAEASRFLARHWDRPLAPQGTAPTALAAQGISLAPASCANCHAAQFEDWSNSLHSRAMGPGLMGQLVNMPAHARDEHQSCIRCHAPLAEQADSLVAALGNPAIKPAAAASASAAAKTQPLHEQGLICAGCHVRGYEVYGPPRRDGSQLSGDLQAYPHGGWKASGAFESSQFCAACHQFKDDEYALNGKLLENTYAEWKSSRYASQGVSCQSCHMPDRRHLWRGIHDPEMVKKGIRIDVGKADVSKQQVSARLTLANTGVGHYFPTYVTPRVVISGFQEDAAGRKLDGTEQHYLIARQVPLDLSREIADTRIAPDAQAVFDYQAPRQANATSLVLQVQVQPDAFYLDFYEALLKDDLKSSSQKMLTQARDDAKASPYMVFTERLPLPR